MKTHLNLLPLPFQRRLIVRCESVRWGAASVVALIVSSLYCLDAGETTREMRSQLDHLTSQAAPLEILAAENRRLAVKLDVSHRRHLLLQSLEGVHPPLQLLGIVSRSASIEDGAIQVRSFVVTPESGGGRPSGRETRQRRQSVSRGGEETANNGQLSLQGIALNEIALSEFVNRLRSDGFFRSVELRSSSNVALPFGSARQYSVECRF